MKCRNCGSELNGNRCENCGTIYGGEISRISIPKAIISDDKPDENTKTDDAIDH